MEGANYIEDEGLAPESRIRPTRPDRKLPLKLFQPAGIQKDVFSKVERRLKMEKSASRSQVTTSRPSCLEGICVAIAETHSGSDDHPPAPEPASKPQGGAKQVFAFAFLLLGAVVAVALLPVKDYLASLLDWTRSMGPWGPAYFVLIYAAACVLFLPGSVLTLGSGFAFGL